MPFWSVAVMALLRSRRVMTPACAIRDRRYAKGRGALSKLYSNLWTVGRPWRRVVTVERVQRATRPSAQSCSRASWFGLGFYDAAIRLRRTPCARRGALAGAASQWLRLMRETLSAPPEPRPEARASHRGNVLAMTDRTPKKRSFRPRPPPLGLPRPLIRFRHWAISCGRALPS